MSPESYCVNDMRGLEKAAHRKLKDCRVNPKREFFECSPAEACAAIESIIEDNMNDIVAIYYEPYADAVVIREEQRKKERDIRDKETAERIAKKKAAAAERERLVAREAQRKRESDLLALEQAQRAQAQKAEVAAKKIKDAAQFRRISRFTWMVPAIIFGIGGYKMAHDPSDEVRIMMGVFGGILFYGCSLVCSPTVVDPTIAINNLKHTWRVQSAWQIGLSLFGLYMLFSIESNAL